MPSTTDIFQTLLKPKVVKQPTQEMVAHIDKESAWQAVAEWLGGQAQHASANLQRFARRQEEEDCYELDHTEEFFEPLLPEFNSFKDFLSKDAAYVRCTGAMLTTTKLSMAYKHAWDWIKPHFDGSEGMAILSLWVVDLEKCRECKAKATKKMQVYGMKLVLPEEEIKNKEIMTPKLYCFCEAGKKVKVFTAGGIRKGIQCECGVQGCFAMLGRNEVNAKFISPQGMLELADGGEEKDIAKMSQDKAISMRFQMHITHSRPDCPDYCPVRVVRNGGSWAIESHKEMFKILSVQSRTEGGDELDYLLKMQEKEWKEDGTLVPDVEGHSAYFVNLASALQIRKLLDCGERLDGITRGMCYWARKSVMHRSLDRYKVMVADEEVEEIEFSSRTNEFDGEEEIRSISYWKNFALVSKLLVKQIMSLRRSKVEKGKKLLEESQTKESMKIKQERSKLEEEISKMEEERLEVTRERASVQQKRHAVEELAAILGETSDRLKQGLTKIKKQKTSAK